jgi:hypothetical protein
VTAFDGSMLSTATRRLVHDARFRARLTSILLQSEPSSSEAEDALNAIDAAVVEILDPAGRPRGPINGPVIARVGRTWFGRKAPDCTLSIDIEAFSLLPDDARPDSLIRTWIHESLHARQPFSRGYQREWREALGYEEGLVEGITRLIAVEWLGLRPVVASYDYYVVSYQTLATVLSVDPERLWRLLWAFPVGEVSLGLVSTVERILLERREPHLSPAQHARLALFGIRHFDSRRVHDRPNEQLLVSAWRSVIE